VSEDLAVYSRKLRPSLKRPALHAAIVLAILALGCAGGWWWMIRMPGSSYEGVHEPTEEERALASELRRDVERLAIEIGVRHDERPEALAEAVSWIDAELGAAGLSVTRHGFDAGMRFENVEGTLAGRSDEIVVVGAHYDSSRHSPAANDNGSGVAALLALARRMTGAPRERTIRFVAFANEEPPHFQKESMGSLVYARACRDRGDAIVAMLSLETIGYYSDDEVSQKYPFPLALFYPSRGDFIAFVGDTGSRALVHRSIETFRDTTDFPSEGAALPISIPGVGWSDHWSFAEVGYEALMVTDTALFRYPHYHTADDLPEHIDYERTARVVLGVERVIEDLASN
jgi:hypothetical protein